jgi:hypothetical protein
MKGSEGRRNRKQAGSGREDAAATTKEGGRADADRAAVAHRRYLEVVNDRNRNIGKPA